MTLPSSELPPPRLWGGRPGADHRAEPAHSLSEQAPQRLWPRRGWAARAPCGAEVRRVRDSCMPHASRFGRGGPKATRLSEDLPSTRLLRVDGHDQDALECDEPEQYGWLIADARGEAPLPVLGTVPDPLPVTRAWPGTRRAGRSGLR